MLLMQIYMVHARTFFNPICFPGAYSSCKPSTFPPRCLSLGHLNAPFTSTTHLKPITSHQLCTMTFKQPTGHTLVKTTARLSFEQSPSALSLRAWRPFKKPTAATLHCHGLPLSQCHAEIVVSPSPPARLSQWRWAQHEQQRDDRSLTIGRLLTAVWPTNANRMGLSWPTQVITFKARLCQRKHLQYLNPSTPSSLSRVCILMEILKKPLGSSHLHASLAGRSLPM